VVEACVLDCVGACEAVLGVEPDEEEVVAPEEPEDVELEPGEEELELDDVDDEPEEAELTVRVLRRELEEDFLATERFTVLTETVVAVALPEEVAEAARTTCVLPVAITAVRIATAAAAVAAVQRVIRFIRRRPAARALLRRVLVSVMKPMEPPPTGNRLPAPCESAVRGVASRGEPWLRFPGRPVCPAAATSSWRRSSPASPRPFPRPRLRRRPAL